MKKIMFNDRYGLTKAVLDGRKTMTRRIIKDENGLYADIRCMKFSHLNEYGNAVMRNSIGFAELVPRYKVGEVVAVAQCYMDAGYDPHMLQFIDIKEPTILPFSDGIPVLGYVEAPIMYHAGWKNKMFVHPRMMPHQIRITDVRVERLQDISDEDCLREGISKPNLWKPHNYTAEGLGYFEEAREAFATLIDGVSGKGTWDSNPYMFVYEFELVK